MGVAIQVTKVMPAARSKYKVWVFHVMSYEEDFTCAFAAENLRKEVVVNVLLRYIGFLPSEDFKQPTEYQYDSYELNDCLEVVWGRAKPKRQSMWMAEVEEQLTLDEEAMMNLIQCQHIPFVYWGFPGTPCVPINVSY